MIDLYVPLVTPFGCAAVAPSFIHARADQLPALPQLTRVGDAFDLTQIIQDPQHPHREHPRVLVGPPIPQHQLLDIDLVRVHDAETGCAWVELRLLGSMLHFLHRGRHVEYDLESLSGCAVAVVARWNPTTISIEVQSHPGSEQPSVAIGFAQRPTISKEVRLVSEGETIDIDRDKHARETARVIDRAIALAVLVKRGTTPEQIEPIVTEIANGAAEAFRQLSLRSGIETPANFLVLPHYALLVEVEDERWQQWKSALGRSDEWIAEIDLAFVRFPLSASLLASAAGIVARAFALRLEQLLDRPLGSSLVPPLFVDEQDALRWFWVQAALGHFLVDQHALEMKAQIEDRVRISGIQEATEAAQLDIAELHTLFDVVGREWLKHKGEKRRGKRAADRARSKIVARLLDADDNRNTAIDSFAVFSSGLALQLVPENGALIDLFAAARTLSSLVTIVRERAPEMIEETVTRLRVTGEDAARAEFEIEMLASLLALGHRAAFVPTESRRTPDIVVRRASGDVYIECARKDALSEDAQSVESFAQELTKYLDSQGHKRRASYQFDVQFNAPLHKESRPRIIEHLKALLNQGGGEFTDEISQSFGRLRTLGDWGRVWRVSTLQSRVGTASRVYITGDFQEGWSVSGHVFHATLVSLTFQTSRRLTKSIENTLRDKGKPRSRGGQVPDGMPTVCAISLGTVDDATVGDVLASAPHLLEARSAVSALVLCWSKRVAENYVPLVIGWRASAFRNPRAKHPLPDDFTLPDGPLAVLAVHSSLSTA